MEAVEAIKCFSCNPVYFVLGQVQELQVLEGLKELEVQGEDEAMGQIQLQLRTPGQASKCVPVGVPDVLEAKPGPHNVVGQNQRDLAPVMSTVQPLSETFRVSRTMFVNGFMHVPQSTETLLYR